MILKVLKESLGEDAGFTRTAANEITIINFRDDTTKLPFIDDQSFVESIESFIEDKKAYFGISSQKTIWAE